MVDVLIRDWDAHLAHEKRRSDHTRRAYIATAERFCGFLAHYRGGAVDARMLKGLTPNDLRSYLADRRADPGFAGIVLDILCKLHRLGGRDFALLLLLYGAGLRIGEALSLTGAALPLGET
ncbi:MAG: recombinase XerC, partial [Sphingopyxis terrae]